jgi:hypothetical protein
MTVRYDERDKKEICRLYRLLKLDDVIKVMKTRGFEARYAFYLDFCLSQSHIAQYIMVSRQIEGMGGA